MRRATGIKRGVANILERYPEARADNRKLVLLLWREQGLPISLEQALNPDCLWQPESIRRARAKIQNEEGRLRPNSQEHRSSHAA